MEKQRVAPYLLRSCYQDADLGTILRSEAFKEFRDTFPEPKDDLFSSDDFDDPDGD
jgi:hypothetical protein